MTQKGRDDCAICLRGLLCEDAHGTMIPLGSAHPCGHCFHKECYQRLSNTAQIWGNPPCPVCRKTIQSFEQIFVSSSKTDVDETVVVEQEEEESWGNTVLVVGGAVLAAVGFVAGFASAKSMSKKRRNDEETT